MHILRDKDDFRFVGNTEVTPETTQRGVHLDV